LLAEDDSTAMTRRALLLALLVVLAGCANVSPTGEYEAPDDWQWPDDPPSDRLGWENGYWYNESIDVDQSDGLSAAEREAFVARTMARIEVIRDLEFTETVPVEVMSRAEYREEFDFGASDDEDFVAWNDQVWEALLIVGENSRTDDELGELYGSSVLGFYSSARDEIVIVSDSETPAIDRGTLAHELVHALQDQQFGLGGGFETQDAQLARNGIVEGDARYVERLYLSRCGDEWDCVPTPQSGSGGDDAGDGGSAGDADSRQSAPSQPNLGLYLTIYQPYSDGPHFVHTLRQEGGWDAVNAVYENMPASTEQTIHPAKYPDEEPVEVTIPDRSASDWSRFDRDPVGDTVGEASLYATFWYQRYVDRSDLRQNTGAFSDFDYNNSVTAGWAGDLVVPYRSDAGEYGYVFRTEWDTPADAREFHDAYTTTLTLMLGGDEVGSGVYRVPDDRPFGDAFRVTRDGTTVTIVNAPTVDQLDAVHRVE
jgi:hypothetical protein